MDSKKLLIMLIAVLVVVIILVIAISNALGGNTSKKRTSGYVDKEYEKQVEKVDKGEISGKYETTNKNVSYYKLDQEGRSDVDKCIDIIMDYFNNDKYEDIYNLLSPKYKNALFTKLSDVERYMKEFKKNGNTKYVASSFEVLADSLLINIANEETTFATLATFRLNNYKELLNNNLEGVEFYFTPVNRIYEAQTASAFSTIKISADYCLETDNTLSYALTIYNTLNEDVKVDFKDTKLITLVAGIEHEYGMVTTRYVTIPAKSSVKYEMGFKKPPISPNYIETVANINGKEEKTRIHLYVNDEY